MAKGDRTVSVLLEVKNGALEENVTVQVDDDGTGPKPISHKKLQRRATKKEFRDLMKDPSKFVYSEIANPDHPTIVLKESPGMGNHEVSFFHFEGFQIFFRAHPDVIDEGEASDGPFSKAGAVITFDSAFNQGGPARPDLFKAGPYKVAKDASKQKFWKFMIVTSSGLTLDPCIITE